MKRWTVGWTCAVAGPALLVIGIGNFVTAGESGDQDGMNKQSAKAEVGSSAPKFALKDAQGNTHSPRQYTKEGKVVVLHFQSTTCPWDRAYQSHLNEVANQYAEPRSKEAKPVQFLAINANQGEDWNDLKPYIEKKNIPYPVLKDHGNEVADMYKARTTPHIFVIDTEGVLQYEGGVEKPPTAVSKVYQMDPNYLEPVLDAVTVGSEPPYRSTQEKGCSIKRE